VPTLGGHLHLNSLRLGTLVKTLCNIGHLARKK
jgi:hypothetical protein